MVFVLSFISCLFLHCFSQAAILYNLKLRHRQGKPYTRTGDIVIACNPYKWYFDLYAETMRHKYAETLVWSTPEGGVDPRASLPPHVYEASSLAYRGLAVEGDDQSILVSGESGAGKTETVKILLNDLATIQRGRHGFAETGQSPIVQRVLDSNPLLEAFGNAKTARNDNSSRFGKYIQLQFDAEDPVAAAYAGKTMPYCILAGSKCEVYLLEKSRVCLHEETLERTYHIFYQLLAAPEEVKCEIWEGLAMTDNESFSYVGYTDTDTIEGNTDGERFQFTLDSLKLVGIEGDKLRTLMRVICTVLVLGNLIFEPDDKDGSTISSTEDLMGCAELLGVTTDDLTAALTIRTIFARNEEFKVPQNDKAAKEVCDAFAKEIYAKTFLWLVRTINDATSAEMNYTGKKKSGFGLIGLLDIFGFESFEINRFEQLCINYANEKLQQKFTQDIFRSVQDEYESEGIELGEITYDDNTDVLDLVEGRMGLLAFLNEECVRPGGSDKGFVSKVAAMNKDNSCFVREKHFYDVQFGVHHYAGKVIYDATAFVTKNMDALSKDLQECAAKSNNEIISRELANEGMTNVKTTASSTMEKKKAALKRPVARSAAAPKNQPASKQSSSTLVAETVWTKFRNQLNSLMSSLNLTRTRYIRCIKPNQLKLPLVMQHQTTIEQLRCAGVVAAVTISRSAFPNRLEHETILDRFKSVWKPGHHVVAQQRASELPLDEQAKFIAERLLKSALEQLVTKRLDGSDVQAFVMGRTRTYFRAGALEYLENERLKRLGIWATEIQKLVRRFVQQSKFRKIRKMVVTEQSILRMRIAHRDYCRLRKASIHTQCWYRCILALRTLVFLRREYKATLIQTHWRMATAITRLKQHVRAAVVVQRIVRGAIQRPKYRKALHEKREEAKLENQVLALQKKLEEAEQRRIEAEKHAEEKARKAIEEARLARQEEEKKAERSLIESDSVDHDSFATPEPEEKSLPEQVEIPESPMHMQLSAQQQTLMDESGRMLEYLRKEVFKLRSQNAQIRSDFDLLKDNNQRLMDANASAGASFAALNQHTKQLAKANEKLQTELSVYKKQTQKLNVTLVELREELKMKQATYVAEVHSRLQYQKALSMIVDLAQDRCRDTRFVEEILKVADACESEYLGGEASRNFATPSPAKSKNDHERRESSGLISSFRSFWS